MIDLVIHKWLFFIFAEKACGSHLTMARENIAFTGLRNGGDLRIGRWICHITLTIIRKL